MNQPKEEIPAPSPQQELERYYFERFRKVYPLPSQAIEYCDKPDVIIAGRRKIGVEITNFHLIDGELPESEQRQRERRESVVAVAQTLYQRGSGKNIELTFGFDEEHPIGSQAAQQRLARRLSEIATQVEDLEENSRIRTSYFDHIPEINFAYLYGHRLEYEPLRDPEFPDGPPEDFIAFRRYTNRQDAHARRTGVRRPLRHPAKWKAIKVHSGGLLPLNRLAEIVAAKERKVRQYTTCDAYWLLVIVDFLNLAQDCEIRIDNFEAFQSQVFEKIVVYRPYFEHFLDNTRSLQTE